MNLLDLLRSVQGQLREHDNEYQHVTDPTVLSELNAEILRLEREVRRPKPLRVAFDIGGVLSKRPDVFRPLVEALIKGGAEVYVITDMHLHSQSVAFVRGNGYDIPEGRVLNADYTTHGEMCKAKVVEEYGIDILVDDFPGYVANTAAVNLFVWPDPTRPYYHDDFKTDGSEGDFGRRRPR